MKVSITFSASASPYNAGDVASFEPAKAKAFVMRGVAFYTNKEDEPDRLRDKEGNIIPEYQRPHATLGKDTAGKDYTDASQDTRYARTTEGTETIVDKDNKGTDRNAQDMYRRQGADDGARGETPGMGAEGFGPGAVPNSDDTNVGNSGGIATGPDVDATVTVNEQATNKDSLGADASTGTTDPSFSKLGVEGGTALKPDDLAGEEADTTGGDDVADNGDDSADNGDSGDAGTTSRRKTRKRL
jgi:hypothetical protein